MLAKLLKYELKATSRLFIPLYFTLLVFATINRFMLPMQNSESSTAYGLTVSISMFVYFALVVAVVVVTLLVMLQRFYKNLLGDEGYLMFTLPVKPWQHIFSKLITSMLWTLASGLVALCSVIIMASLTIPWQELFSELPELFEEFQRFFGQAGFLVIIETVVLGILTLASTILSIYAAIGLGHLFNKHRLLISFGMYLLVKSVAQALLGIATILFSGQLLVALSIMPNLWQANSVLLALILYYAAISIAYFMITNFILTKKLNLE